MRVPSQCAWAEVSQPSEARFPLRAKQRAKTPTPYIAATLVLTRLPVLTAVAAAPA
jgi:hypothetical protein